MPTIPVKVGNLLRIPQFKRDGTPYDWAGRIPKQTDVVNLPVLWFDRQLSEYYTGIRGRTDTGHLLRMPRCLFIPVSQFSDDLRVIYQDKIDEIGLLIDDGQSGSNIISYGLTGFLPSRAGFATADPEEYIGGELYWTAYLEEGLHFEFTEGSVEGGSFPYEEYIYDEPTTSWILTGGGTYTPSDVLYRNGITELPDFASACAIAQAGLERFSRARLDLWVPTGEPVEHFDQITSLVPTFYGPSTTLPDIPTFIYLHSHFNSGTGIYNVYWVEAVFTEVADEQAAWDAVAALGAAAAAAIGPECVVRLSDDINETGTITGDMSVILPDVVEFFDLDA